MNPWLLVEKRLIQHMMASCPTAPPDLPQQIEALIGATAVGQNGRGLIDQVNLLLGGLDGMLAAEGLG